MFGPLPGTRTRHAHHEDVYKELKQVFDPEIPVNIVDLGLVYDVKVQDTGVCNVTMTLTSQSCPKRARSPRS